MSQYIKRNRTMMHHLKINFPLILFIFLMNAAFAQSDLWIDKPNLGNGQAGLKRTGAVSFSIDGIVYVALGKDGSTYHDDLWAYDTNSETWEQKADYASGGRTGAFAFMMNNKGVVGTGENSSGNLTQSVFIYNPASNTWQAVANFSGGNRVYASSFSTGTRGFVVGGSDGSFQNDLWEYDINADSWISKGVFPGTARIKAVAFALGNTAYFGTGDIGVGTYTNDFFEYDIPTNTWTQIADFPGSARAGAIGCAANATAYLGLGNSGSFLVDFWSFDGVSWVQHSDFTGAARELAVAEITGNKVYVGTGFGGSYYDDFFQWDPCAVPQIIVQPVGLNVCEGTDVSFSVEISNPGSETYEWLLDGSPITGANSELLVISGVTELDEGSYSCKITNDCGTSLSDVAFLEVIPIPVNSPTGLSATPDTICPDNSFDIILSGQDNGNPEDTLVWYANGCGGDIIGLGFPVFNEVQVTPPIPPTSIEYYARWENQCGETDCDTVFIFAKENAVEPISIEVSEDTICKDFNEDLFLSVEGGSGDFVAWYLGNVCENSSAPLIDTGIMINLFELDQIPDETTTYSARWETYCNDSEFHSECLTIDINVDGDFSINQQPENQSVCEGEESVLFFVGVDQGEAITEIFFQWYFEGNALTGAQDDTLFVFDILTADSGYYYCRLATVCDTIFSDSAFLTVNTFPEFVIEPEILDTICEGDSLTLTVLAEGSPELQYMWYFNSIPIGVIDTFLTVNPATFSNSGDYFCVVTNSCSSDTSNIVSFEVDTIPYIVEQPLDLIVCLNGTAQFTTLAEGTIPIEYQWYRIDENGVSSSIPGASANTFEISPVLPADTAFDYYCLTSNECFDGISSDTVDLLMHPQIEIMDSIVSDVNNVCYTYSNLIELTVFGGEGDSLRWFTGGCGEEQYAISADTILKIPAPEVTTTFYARWENACDTSACDSITIYIAQDPIVMDTMFFEDNNICFNTYDSLLLTAVGGLGDSIRWFEGTDCSGVPFAVTADTFLYVKDFPPSTSSYAAYWFNACGESECYTVDLFINDFTLIFNQSEDFEVCEGASTFMFVEATGLEPLNYQWFLNGNEIAGELNDTLIVEPVSFADTGMYYCQVWSECDTVLSDSIHLVMLELPYFTLQPADTAVCEGSRDTIQIKIAGDEPLLVQWYKNEVEFGGAQIDDTLLILDPVYETAEYYAVIFNSCGETSSDTITHRSLDTLVVLEQPKDVSLCLFDTARFFAGVESTEFVEFNWFKLEDMSLVGTNPLLEITNLDYPDEGLYFCIVSDTCGEISTDTVLLNMNQIPSFDSDPFGQTVCEGSYFEFQVTLDEFLDPIEDSIQFRWNQNGDWIENSNSLAFEFDPVMRGDEGDYFVEAFNNCGRIESQPAVLFVNYLPDPLEAVLADQDTICEDNDFDLITLTAIGDGGGYGTKIEWYRDEVGPLFKIGEGVSINTTVPTVTTEYFARWVNSCTDSDGSSGSLPGGGTHEAESVVVVFQTDPIPPSSLLTSNNNFCISNGDSLLLEASGGSGDIVEWYKVPEMEFLGEGVEIKVVQPMDTTIFAARWVNYCGVSDSTTIQINVVPLPIASAIDADTICAGQPYKITDAFANHFDSLRWTTSHGEGYFDTNYIANPTYYNEEINLNDTLTQYLYLVVYGKADCADAYDTIKLVTTPLPNIIIDPEYPAVCRDSLITMTASGAQDYYWTENGGDYRIWEENPITISVVETEEFRLIATDSRGCVDSIIFDLEVYPTPLVDLGDSLFLFSCDPIKLDAGGGDGSEYYIWSTGFRTRSISVYETGDYFVTVGNPGCEVTDTAHVNLCGGRLFMPNAFSPNKDGINETFKPITSDPSIEFHMMIFDRWGQMVFETYDLFEGWNGDFNGEACPSGNYVYRIEYQGQGVDSPGRKGSDFGTVMLIR
jgi:gliding motility-associated-like protein